MNFVKKGFTLIELLIVVSIISLIVITGFFLARNQFLKGRDARRKADMHKIQEAVEEYEKDHDCYPPPPPDPTTNCDPGTGLKPYLSQIPCDIATGLSFYYETDNPGGCGKWYRIFILLDNLNDKDIIPAIGPGSKYNFYLASPNAPVPTSAASPIPTPTPPTCSDYWGCKDGVCILVPREPPDCLPICQPGYDALNICEQACPGLECTP